MKKHLFILLSVGLISSVHASAWKELVCLVLRISKKSAKVAAEVGKAQLEDTIQKHVHGQSSPCEKVLKKAKKEIL